MDKLIETILRGNLHVGAGAPTRKSYQAINYLLRQAVYVDMHNVYEWFLDQPVGEKPPQDVLPIARLPYETMWFEFTSLIEVEHLDGTVEKHVPVRVGVLCTDDEENHRIGFDLFSSIGMAETYHAGIPVLEFSAEVNYDENFTVKNNGFICFFHKNTDDNEPVRNWFRDKVTAAMAAITFFHCKNVGIRKILNSKKSARTFNRKYGFEKPEFHVIDVHKPKTSGTATGNHRPGSQLFGAQIIRGHVKHYDDDHKLFGKIAGCWFWKPHVRGEGPITQNDYKVHPPTPKHQPGCLIEEGK